MNLTSKQKSYLLSALIPMGIMTVVWFLMGVFPFGDKTLMAVDFGQQYIGLYGFLKETILNLDFSGLFYSFSKSIGGAMIGIWGFNLISPFNLFYVILPLSQFKWAITLSILFRYGATGLAFYHLLVKRYKGLENKKLSLLMSTAYTLSGMIVSYQMNPIFYDAMIMLPLVIIALEEVLDGAKPFKYVSLLATTLVLHFYMGYMISLFVALYTIFYLSKKYTSKEDLKVLLKPALKALAYSLVAVGSVMILLLPIFLNLLRSKGAYESSMTFHWNLQINPFDIFAKLFVGAFDNESWPHGPNLPNIYIGAFALVGFATYLFNKNIYKYSRIVAGAITAIFLLSFSHEFTNKIWHMGQTPAGFFYRFSWIMSFFMVLLAYQSIKNKINISENVKKAILSFFLIGFVYVNNQLSKFTFIKLVHDEKLTEWINANTILITILLVVTSVYTASYFKKKTNRHLFTTSVVGIVTYLILITLIKQGLLLSQLPITVLTYAVALSYLLWKNKFVSMKLLAIVTAFELGYNAYLSQVRIGYDTVYRLENVSSEFQDVVEKAKEDKDFYRIATNFFFAKNDPFHLGFNGLSSFSSNMEKSTIDLFGSFGDVGGNASTAYTNGNHFTDTFYGIKYYIEAKEKPAENTNIKDSYLPQVSTRFDVEDLFEKVYENKKYILYKSKSKDNSIAFGVNSKAANIKFGLNNPVSNLNFILDQATGKSNEVFKKHNFSEIQLDNMERIESNGTIIYKAKDTSKPGSAVFKFVPATDSKYYMIAPYVLRKSKGEIEVRLNEKWYKYTQSFDQIQLWNIANKSRGQEIQIRVSSIPGKPQEFDLTNLLLVKEDTAKLQEIMNTTFSQRLNIEKWNNNSIKGSIEITDENTDRILTSIPYNPGWKIKVDGKEVQGIETWESVLSFPISKGKHTVELVFIPEGFRTGALISSIAIASTVGYWFYLKKKEN